jgi:hypothetical protein
MAVTEIKVPPQDYAAALSRVRDYREQLQHADRQADQNSLDRARDLELLYQSMRWVDEVPAPKHVIWRGRPVDPRSRNRFATWVLQQTGLSTSYTRRFASAVELMNSCDSVTRIPPSGEGALRPLQRLRRAGYGEHVGSVYKQAIELAEGGPVTSSETKQAVRDFLAKYTRTERRQHQATNWFEQRRAAIIRDFTVLLDAGQHATAEQTLNDLLAAYHAHVPGDAQ